MTDHSKIDMDQHDDIAHLTCLVTGGAGFIGSHLVDELAKKHRDNLVIIIDDLSTGNIDNIAHFFKKSDVDELSTLDRETIDEKESFDELIILFSTEHNVLFIHGDIQEKNVLDYVFEKYQVDVVFHLAAQISVPKSMKCPQLTHEINVNGFFQLLTFCKNQGDVKKVVFSSSCAVYGDPDEQDLPLTELALVRPASPYATTKLIGEEYAFLFSHVFNVPTTCLRYFNVYGPRQDPKGEYAAVIPKFIKRAKNDRSLIIFGDGSQTRDFVYVKDVVSANLLAASTVKTGVFHIGSGSYVTIKDLAQMILGLMNKTVDMRFEDMRMGDILHSYADISKVKKELGFHPMYSIQDGLIKTIDWFLKRKKEKD